MPNKFEKTVKTIPQSADPFLYASVKFDSFSDNSIFYNKIISKLTRYSLRVYINSSNFNPRVNPNRVNFQL